MAKLGVNIDHIATIRNQRGTKYPEPIAAALIAQQAGAEQITVHLREDRRHICERDVTILKEILQVPLNLEIANTNEMIDFALKIKPFMVTLVPEKREEKTTEGGLDIKKYYAQLKETVILLQKNAISVSLFIEPSLADIDLSKEISAQMIELHTGKYSEAQPYSSIYMQELQKIIDAAQYAHAQKIIVHAGHGLHYANARAIAKIEFIQDLNIGHSIISHALFVGLDQAVKEMKNVIS